MILNQGFKSTSLWHTCHLPFRVRCFRPSKQLDSWVAWRATILESSTGYKDALRQFFSSYQRNLCFTKLFNSFTVQSFTCASVTPLIFSYLSLAAFPNDDMMVPLFSCCCSFRHQEKEIIYSRQQSRCRSKHDTWLLQWSSRVQFRIQWWASLATIQASNGQAAIQWFIHINTWKTSCSNTNHCYSGATPTSWVSGGL